MNKNQKRFTRDNYLSGFAHLFLVLVIVLAGVGALGYFVYKNGQTKFFPTDKKDSEYISQECGVCGPQGMHNIGGAQCASGLNCENSYPGGASTVSFCVKPGETIKKCLDQLDSKSDSQQLKNWKEYSNDEYKFSFKYPGDWTADQVQGFSFPIFLKSAKEEFYIVNIHQVKNSNLDRELETDATTNSGQDSSIHLNRDIKIAGKDSIQVTGKHKDSGLIKGGFVVTMIQNGPDVIKVTLDYDSYYEEYNQILSTFELNN